MIVIAGTATVKPEKWEEAAQRAQKMSQATEAEQGCISYRFYVRPEDRNTFFIFEEWENQEALMRHFQARHFQEFGAYLSSVVTTPPNIKRYVVSESAPL